MGFGESLMFTGAFLAAAGWITFVILAKGTQDFQSSDLVIPAILTAIAVLLGWLGFSRQRRTRRDLKEATASTLATRSIGTTQSADCLALSDTPSP